MDDTILQQARTLTGLLPTVMRKLFAYDGDGAEELPLAQLRVCSMLADGPRSMSALGRELGVSLSAMTQIADRLERADLVQRLSEENDRRIRHLQLTEQGANLMRRRTDAHVKQVLHALEQLSSRERSDVLLGLEVLASVCEAMEGQNSLSAVI